MGWVQVEGAKLWFEEQGSGRPLLFLHGFTLDRRMWASQVLALAGRFRVITYDARGFGKSDMPAVGVPYKHCDDAAAVCEKLGLERVIGVGHSIGAHQMLELALTHPKRIAGLVCVAASGLAGIPFPDDIMKMFGDVRKLANERSIEEAKRLWATSKWFAHAREVPELAAQLDVMLADFSGWHWTHDNPATNIVPPAAERLGELAIPVSVIVGGRDLPYNHAIADALVAGIRGATLARLPNAGHMANMEDPVGANEAIARLAAN
jgi:pimeloyl-ACP methyl ester carboxylesterase